METANSDATTDTPTLNVTEYSPSPSSSKLDTTTTNYADASTPLTSLLTTQQGGQEPKQTPEKVEDTSTGIFRSRSDNNLTYFRTRTTQTNAETSIDIEKEIKQTSEGETLASLIDSVYYTKGVSSASQASTPSPISQISNPPPDHIPIVEAPPPESPAIIDPERATRKPPGYVPLRKDKPNVLFASQPNGWKLRTCLLIIMILSVIGIFLVIFLGTLYYQKYMKKK